MPSKGYQTLGEQLENVAMRLPVSVLAQVDAHIDTLRKSAPWAKVGRSDALRDLVVRGLASASQPQPTPPTPAIPLALEPAPTAEVPHKRKTPSTRAQRGLPQETLQQIAETAAQYDKMSLSELSQLLFDRGIHRATDSTIGEEKPVHPGTLKKQLDRAREQGLL